MKSEAKLVSAIEKLQSLIAVENTGVFAEEALRLMKEVLTDNQSQVKVGNVDIWKCIANDELRPVMCGVCHDHENKKAVASDGHILYVSSALYDATKVVPQEKLQKLQNDIDNAEDDAHKSMYQRWMDSMQKKCIVDKYGKYIEGTYPNWPAVIPNEDMVDLNIPYSVSDIKAMLTEARAAFKVRKARRCGSFDSSIMFHIPCDANVQNGCIRNNRIGVAIPYLMQMMAFGLDGWQISTKNGMMLKRTDTELMLVMPMYIEDCNDYDYRREWRLTEHTSSRAVSNLNPDVSVVE